MSRDASGASVMMMWYAGGAAAVALAGPSVVGSLLRGAGGAVAGAATCVRRHLFPSDAAAADAELAAERVAYARDMGRVVCDRYRALGLVRGRALGRSVAAIERVLGLLDAAVRGEDARRTRLWAAEVLRRIEVLRNVAALTASESVLVDALLEF